MVLHKNCFRTPRDIVRVVYIRAGKNLGFLEKVFRFLKVFLDFSVEIRLDTKFPPTKNILYTIHSLSEHFL